MKIAIVCYPSYGGSGVIATELGKKMALRGHEVHFISYERPFKLDLFHENLYFHEVEIFDYPLFKFPPYSIALASKIVEVARCAGLDIVHVHYAMPHAISAYLAKQMLSSSDLPFITTLHGTDITLVGSDKQFYDATKFSIEESDGVTAVSNSLKQETQSIFETKKDIHTIHNFIDTKQFYRAENPVLRQRYAQPDESILIHISNFRAVKRIEDICEIFAIVNQKKPSKLLLVGDGPEIIKAQEFASKNSLRDRIVFLGKQERVTELLSISDLFLLPSSKESFGLVALEAMACEVPVIAAKTGGIPEVVNDGSSGFLSPVGDVENMATNALMLLENDSLHRRFREAARERAITTFSSEKILPVYESFYREIIEQC